MPLSVSFPVNYWANSSSSPCIPREAMLSSFPSPPHLSLFRSAMRFPLCKHPPPPLSTEREDGRPTPSSVTFFSPNSTHTKRRTVMRRAAAASSLFSGLFIFLPPLFVSPQVQTHSANSPPSIPTLVPPVKKGGNPPVILPDEKRPSLPHAQFGRVKIPVFHSLLLPRRRRREREMSGLGVRSL